MQEIQFYLVDAFSDKNFGGNAAAVCPLSEWLADDVLLKMAQQHNQSETAFFVRTDEGYELRWFTTLAEINLCGHATLAAAHVIFEYLDHPSATILFSTRFVGELRVTRNGDDSMLIETSNGQMRLNLADILYLESIRHTIVIHTLEGKLSINGTLKDMEAKLADHHFFRSNSCYLVNLKHVTGVADQDCIMSNGEQLRVSRPRKKAFMAALTDYMGGGR